MEVHPLVEYGNELRRIFGLQIEVDAALSEWLTRLQALANPANTIYFGRSGPTDEGASFQHWGTIGEVCARATKDGEHSRRLRRMAIVFAYTYWDVETRAKVAKLCGKETTEITHPVFGDLRKLRQAVLHVSGRIDKNMEVLTFLKKGDLVDLSSEHFHELFRMLTLSLNDIARDYVNTSSAFKFDHTLRTPVAEDVEWQPDEHGAGKVHRLKVGADK